MDLLNNKHMIKLTSILTEIGERVEGNFICDISPTNYTIHQNLAKIKNLQVLSRGKTKICEIGVNAGHSLLIMLLENPTAHYLLFDLNNHRYTVPCLNYLKESFPSATLNLIVGDSVKTVPQYLCDFPDELHTFDLCHIDGGHTLDV